MRVSILGLNDDQIRELTSRLGLTLSSEEWRHLAGTLDRDPTLPEAFLFDVGLSEHCSYKSSRALLKKHLPPLASHVVLGPGEDSGVVSLGEWNGEEWVLVVAHESHNHPSQVLPVEGAATGIGGIVRDVYCMGADVIGVMDGLRFGDPDGPNGGRCRAIARGVIRGISEYGNALGVPNLGGDVVFRSGFDDNCLVNVVALGIMPRRRLIRSRVPEEARREPYILVLTGKPTDSTGLGGASFASRILDETGDRDNRGAVQIHDPFLKRVLAEAMLEAFSWAEENGVLLGCKDLGAGGLGGASSELVLAGGFGAEIDLTAVPQALPDLQAHQVLCAETQERYVWAIPEKAVEAFCAIFNESFELGRAWPGAAAAVIGRVLPEPVYRCFWNGEMVVDLPGSMLETPPPLHRPQSPRPVPPPAGDPEPPVDWKTWAAEQLTSLDACCRAPIFRFYDQEVRGEAFYRPGEADAGICRPIPGTSLGVAVSLDGSPDYGALDPYWAGALAVLESARNVAATGARPLALTDCMNFGNPEDPVCLQDFEDALAGMADACRAVGSPGRPEEPLPIVSGNVSFYNQSATGRAIPPSPIICCYGLLRDHVKAVSHRLKAPGNHLLFTGIRRQAWGGLAGGAGVVPRPQLAQEGREIRLLPDLIDAGLVEACHDISEGGILRALWEMMAGGDDQPSPLGIELTLDPLSSLADGIGAPHELLLSESPGFVLEVESQRLGQVTEAFASALLPIVDAGVVLDSPRLIVKGPAGHLFTLESAGLHRAWAGKLETITHTEGGR